MPISIESLISTTEATLLAQQSAAAGRASAISRYSGI
jgi:hypothetical protein